MIKHLVKGFVDKQFDPNQTYEEQKISVKSVLHNYICGSHPILFIGHSKNDCAIQRFARDYFIFNHRRYYLQCSANKKLQFVRHRAHTRAGSRHPSTPTTTAVENISLTPPTRQVQDPPDPSARTSNNEKGPKINPLLRHFTTKKDTQQRLAMPQSLRPEKRGSIPWVSPPSLNPTILPKYRINEVEAFLKSCFPDMRHLLNAFMDYGILNRQYLLVIAGWPPEKIDQLLREIGTSTMFNDLGPTEMDIKILIKHFKDYFNAK